jgi:hypothetical protein
LHTARDQLIKATNVIAETVIDVVGSIGRTVLANLMPPRRLRVSPRAVKRPLRRERSLAFARQPQTYLGVFLTHIQRRYPVWAVVCRASARW